MKNLSYLKASLILLPLAFLAFVSPLKNIPNNTYFIASNSKLEIKGTTNINSFNCQCKEELMPQTFYLEQSANRHKYYFSNTSLKIKINTFDCGNKMMNKDLQKSLNAEKHPNIEIKLLEIIEDNCNSLTELKDWVKITALTNISLNGISKQYPIEITAKKFSANKFRFIGTKPILMSEFNIDPPTAMMGMVKVQDEIKINLDLYIEVKN